MSHIIRQWLTKERRPKGEGTSLEKENRSRRPSPLTAIHTVSIHLQKLKLGVLHNKGNKRKSLQSDLSAEQEMSLNNKKKR